MPSKTLIYIDEERKILQDKTKFKQHLSANVALQRILEGKLQQRKVPAPKKDKILNISQ